MTPTEAWLDRLLAHPTVSADSNLALVAELQAALLAKGAVCETFPDPTGQKAALLARLGPEAEGGLMLSAHLDVVPVAGQDWTVPPFAATRRDDRIYGRGATDMKGFVGAVMALAEAMDTARLTRPLWIALSYDEEIGCVGVQPMLDEIARRGIRPDLVLVGEPTSMRIGIGHKGKLGMKAEARGKARHSSEAPLALNALYLACDLTAGLRALQDEIAATGAREDGYTVPYTTLHVGVMAGGTALNIVPERAAMTFEARLIAADRLDDIAAQIAALAARITMGVAAQFPDCGIEVREFNRYPGLASNPQSPGIAVFAECLPIGTETCKLSYGTEGGLFAERLGVPVVVCGPGDMAQGHQPDEFIETSELAACDAMLVRATDRFCTA